MKNINLINTDMLGYLEKLVEKMENLDQLTIELENGEKLYKAEIHLLVMISENPDAHLSELARLLNVTRGMISQLAKKVEDKGLVVKKKATGSNRNILLELTGEGKQVVGWHGEFHEEMNEDFQAYFSTLEEKDKDTILNFLQFTDDYIMRLINKRTPE